MFISRYRFTYSSIKELWIMMDHIGIVIFAILFPLIIWRTYKLGFKSGYKTGAYEVLNEWKKYMDDGGNGNE